jgi:DNA polymerase-1
VKKDKSYVGLNALIQGSAADIMKQGLINVDDAVRPLGGIPLLVVHDEVVVEVPTENADEALQRMEEALIAAYSLNPKLAVEGSVVHTSYADA